MNSMRLNRYVMVILFAIINAGIGFSQTVKLDMTEVDTGIVELKGVTSNTVVATDSIADVVLDSSKTMEVQMKYDDTKHTALKVTVDSAGSVTDVQWKENSDSSGTYKTMDASRYSLDNGGTEIKFLGCPVTIDNSVLDINGFYLEFYDPINNESKAIEDNRSSGTFDLFPGNYRMVSPASNSSISFLVNDDCSIDDEVKYRLEDNGGSNWELLHVDQFQISGSALIFDGVEISASIHLSSNQVAELIGFNAGKQFLSDNTPLFVRVLPGEYDISMTKDANPVADLQFQVLNKTSRLSPDFYWRNLEVAEPKVDLEKTASGTVYMTPESFSAGSGFPLALAGAGTMPYAILKDKLDAGYYTAVGGELRVRYNERYNENTDLNLKIYDASHQEISLANPVARQYGTNWIVLQLAGANFSVGEYYVLEVRSEKGDLSMLRFRYDQ